MAHSQSNVSLEHMIDSYIYDHQLAQGSRLPPLRELAAAFGCDDEALAAALQAAEGNRKLAYDDGVWTVLAPAVVSDDAFSFTSSAHGMDLTTEVLERTQRLPVVDKEYPFYAFEQRAQRALGLGSGEPFIVIVRLRILGGHPGAIHRAYLNPSRFPEDFLSRHDFKTESLIALYRQYRYRLLTRDTILSARLANNYDLLDLKTARHTLQSRAVLDAEQQLHAAASASESPFVLEFLKASYFDHWKYEVKNRPASA